ncbi:conserved hypothetical protein [Ricinus communis]|uniref:Uncharacterized protein n=1 Tax=Ricinus communis TaxID=3988 RepID=B9T787_RICCO|nr:conserved hypothetical protein [Ricinus communis]
MNEPILIEESVELLEGENGKGTKIRGKDIEFDSSSASKGEKQDDQGNEDLNNANEKDVTATAYD